MKSPFLSQVLRTRKACVALGVENKLLLELETLCGGLQYATARHAKHKEDKVSDSNIIGSRSICWKNLWLLRN